MTRPLQVLVIGEALIDIVVTTTETDEHVGGSPLNVAVGLARLNHPTCLLTSLGDDERGRAITDYVFANHIELISSPTVTTSTAVARIAADGSAGYEFDLYWPTTADPGGTFDVVHTGSIGLFLEPGGGSVRNILRHRRADSLITVDPNIRPSIVDSHDSVLTQFEATARLADVVKLSDEDAAWLYPRLSVDDVLGHLLSVGPRVVVVTQGADGSTLASPAERVAVPVEPVVVVDTIGAGDSYMSALVHGLGGLGTEVIRTGDPLDSNELTRVGAFAARVAAITVARRGAQPPTLAEVEPVTPPARGPHQFDGT